MWAAREKYRSQLRQVYFGLPAAGRTETYHFPDKFERYTPNTIVTEQQLWEQLEVVRRDGYAIENERGEMGLFCCGAPFFSSGRTCVPGR